MLAFLSVDGYEDTIADLVVDRLGEMPLAGRVLDQEDLAGADLSGFAVAGGEPCDRDLWEMGWTTQVRMNVRDVDPLKER